LPTYTEPRRGPLHDKSAFRCAPNSYVSIIPRVMDIDRAARSSGRTGPPAGHVWQADLLPSSQVLIVAMGIEYLRRATTANPHRRRGARNPKIANPVRPIRFRRRHRNRWTHRSSRRWKRRRGKPDSSGGFLRRNPLEAAAGSSAYGRQIIRFGAVPVSHLANSIIVHIGGSRAGGLAQRGQASAVLARVERRSLCGCA
jgi:hypothetical protein